MTSPSVAPFGSWKSPISADVLSSHGLMFAQIEVDGGDIYWNEARPSEEGRSVVVRRRPDGTVEDVTPQPFNVRSRVHEYGGRSFLVHDGAVIFCELSDQRLYRQEIGRGPVPLTPDGPLRYLDGVADGRRGRMIWVCEDHGHANREPVNSLVSVELEGESKPDTIVSGNDFYLWPRLSHEGNQLAWVTWNHPNMRWDSSELWAATLGPDGSVVDAQLVAGGSAEAVAGLAWSEDGVLYFISDRRGWDNLYRWDGSKVTPVIELQAELGAPSIVSPQAAILTMTENGKTSLARVNLEAEKLEKIPLPYTYIATPQAGATGVVTMVGSPALPISIALIDPDTYDVQILRTSSRVEIDPAYVSLPEMIEFPTADGLTAHAYFYRPHNPGFVGPSGRLPPLLVHAHGGPILAAFTGLMLGLGAFTVPCYWTSRGFAYLDVDYRGSTGYGRAYREQLHGQWGVADVEDCIAGARHLVSQGMVDPERLVIRGASAGGYTTLAAMTFRDVFAAAMDYCGLSDLELMAKETHKYESHYLDSLVGPYPEAARKYHDRSPIHFADQIKRPLLVLQGLDDKVVPPNQAELIVESLKHRGHPVAYGAFEGEGHGMRRAENIKRSLEYELYFYSQVFGFELPEPVETLPIHNLR
jgi:dipeptidyl aminopeptidase/acylaminoacyl peptidase